MSAPVNEGDVLGGKFRVERVLGTGGMGVIVAAYHLQLDQHVALKFLLPDAAKDEAVVQRFAREARAAAKIQSEHVARVLDVGTLDTGAPYMVMEYLDGKDLDQILKANGPLTVLETVGYVMQACEAIAEAHALGIVHRDLKPANLFVAERADGKKSIKVLDFGISKVMPGGSQQAEPALTNTSAIMGSPMYMSPEQLRSSRDVDARADIWALGVVLYECLAGTGPFAFGTVAEVCAAILKDVPKPLREVRAGVPEGLDLVVGRCLEKDVEKRYANVAELTVALLSFGPPGSEISIERVSSVLRNISLSQRASPFTKRDVDAAPGSMTTPEIPSAKDAAPASVTAAERARLELAATKASHPAGLADGTRPTEPGTPTSIAKSDASATASAVSRSSWNSTPAKPKSRGPLFAVLGLLVVGAAGGGFAFWRSTQGGATTASSSDVGTPAPSQGSSAAPSPATATVTATAPSAAPAEPEAPEPAEAPSDDAPVKPKLFGKLPKAAGSATPSAAPSASAAVAPPPSVSASAAAKAPPASDSASPKAAPAPSASAKAGAKPASK